MQSRRIFALLPLLLGAVVLLPFLRGHWRLADDAYYSNLPAMLLQARTIAEGMWPLWNPNIGVGQPWALSPWSSGLYYPPQTLWGLVVGWTEFSYLGYVLLHLTLAGYLAAVFGRRIGFSGEACLFLGLAYVGNGFALGFLSNPNLLICWTFWPLLGLGLAGLNGPVQARPWAARAVAAALYAILVGGYPLLTLVIVVSSLALYFLLARRQGLRLKALTTACAGAALMSAPAWFTTFEALKLSDRVASDIYDQALYHNAFNFLQLATLVLPSQFLKRDEQQLGIMHLERSWWVGSLTLAMLLAAARRRWLSAPWLAPAAGVALVGLLYALGGNSFARELASAGAPLLEHMRHSHLARAPLMALLCVAGAAGFDSLLAQTGYPKPGARPNRAVTAWYAYLALAAILALSESYRQIDGSQVYLDAASGWKAEFLHTGFYLCLAFTLYETRAALRPWMRLGTALLAVQFLSLADTGYAFRHLIGVRTDTPIKAVDPNFRVASPQPNERVIKRWFDGQDWYSWEGNAKILHAYFPPNHRGLQSALSAPLPSGFLGKLASCEGGPCELRIDRWFGNVIELSGRSNGPVRVLAHDLNDPCWHATVNDRPTPVSNAYGLFKQVEAPAGEWRVRFEYIHPWMPLLVFLSLAGFALVAVAPRRLVR